MSPKKYHKKVDKEKPWTTGDILKLIDFYRENELLWNSKHLDFHRKPKRDAKISDVISILDKDFTHDDVRMKWRNLRNYYAGEVKKEKEGKKYRGRTRPYESTWQFFPNLEFIRDHLNSAPTYNDTSDFPKDDDDKPQHDDGGNSEDCLSAWMEVEHDNGEPIKACPKKVVVFEKPKPQPKSKVVELESDESMKSSFVREAIAALKSANPPTPVTANEAFGKHIVLSLDALTEYNRNWAKCEIQKILFQASCPIQNPSLTLTNDVNFAIPQ